MTERAGTPSPDVGIAGVAYHLPATVMSVRELATAGLLAGEPAPLEQFGFARAHVARDETAWEMATRAARRILEETDTDPADVDVVLYAGAPASSSVVPCTPPANAALHLAELNELFRYPVSLLQNELDLVNARVIGVGQQGCASILSAVELGRAMLLTDPDVAVVLCVAADRMPDNTPRDVVYNVVSDGACAVMLRREATMNRILGYQQISKPMPWDASLDAEVISAYFPTAVAVVERVLRKARLSMDDVAMIIPHNVSLRSWEILLGMLGAPMEKLFSANIARVGHTMSADNFVNLRDAQDAGLLRRGDRVLLFTFGFGLNWAAMILEH